MWRAQVRGKQLGIFASKSEAALEVAKYMRTNNLSWDADGETTRPSTATQVDNEVVCMSMFMIMPLHMIMHPHHEHAPSHEHALSS